MIYPAISLWQPWASLLFTDPPTKIHETRHWPAPDRLIGQRVVIHAAKHPIGRNDIEPELAEICSRAWPELDWRHSLPFGAFVGSAVLTSSKFMTKTTATLSASGADYWSGNWESGRYAWRLDDRRAFAQPIPAKGRQGWFTADIDTA